MFSISFGVDGFVAASADSLDETGAGSCGLAGIGGSKGGMKTAEGAGSVGGAGVVPAMVPAVA